MLSKRKDLQVRDPRTDLSTFLYRRGFFTWARSLLKWVPIASTVVGIFDLLDCVVEWKSNSWAGKLACVLGGILTTIGAGGQLWSTIAGGLSGGSSTASEVLQWVNDAFDISTMYLMTPRDADASSPINPASMVFPGFRHIRDGSNVTLVHLARSNETHPLKLTHHSKALDKPVPIKLWPSWNNATSTPRLNVKTPLSWFSTNSSKLRARCSSGWYDYNDGQIDVCEYPETVSTGSAATIPREIYYGVDLYGTKNEIIEYEDNLGVTYSDTNGEVSAYVAMAENIANDNAWDTCVCMQDAGNWIATGSLQMSWDGVYSKPLHLRHFLTMMLYSPVSKLIRCADGYSPCWNPNCDNAADIGK
jgi:hypothetical protein